jgi:hydroxymethylbilane synthase
LISKSAASLSEIPRGATVATSSPRRARQISFHRPDLQLTDIRGNVPTRIAKLLADDSLDSLLLAKAGLERLGYQLTGGRLSFENHQLLVTDLREILPAPGQGAIGLEIRAHDSETRTFLSGVNDPSTWFCTSVEREFLRLFGGGCSLPLGVRTSLNGRVLRCEAIIFDESDEPQTGALSGEFKNPQAAAEALLNIIYEKGK